jgi:hypothetical protein
MLDRIGDEEGPPGTPLLLEPGPMLDVLLARIWGVGEAGRSGFRTIGELLRGCCCCCKYGAAALRDLNHQTQNLGPRHHS